MDNPYESPKYGEADGLVEGVPEPPPPKIGPSVLLRQVRIVAVLMFVQAGLEVLMGVTMFVAAGFMGFVFSTAMAEAPVSGPDGPPPEWLLYIMPGYYIAIGALCLTAAGLKIVAGIRNLRYRGRVLGFVALGSGILTILTCYCAPTAIGLAVYGLIVYLDRDVAWAFQLGRRGYTVDQILAAAEQPYSWEGVVDGTAGAHEGPVQE